MRICRRRSALGLSAIIVLLLGDTTAAEPRDVFRLGEACAFGERLVKNLEPGSVLDDRPVEPPSTHTPADNTVKAWRSRGATNLFISCPELRTSLPPGVRFASRNDYAELERRPPERSVHIMSFMAPFVSDDGRELIHAQSWRCTGLCGGSFVQRLYKTPTGWSAPENLALVIS